MFKVNDIVTYGINGVCKIVGTEEKDLLGIKKNYFILKPLSGDKSTYYVPTDNKNLLSKLRKLLSKTEINELIDSMPNEKGLWYDNEKERKECYKKIVANADRTELIRMIKAIHTEKKLREESGKKLHLSDERFLKEAVKILYDEFKYVLQLPENEVLPYIFARLEKSINNF